MEISRLTQFIHKRYEYHMKCKADYAEIPEKNKKVMLNVSKDIIKLFRLEKKEQVELLKKKLKEAENITDTAFTYGYVYDRIDEVFLDIKKC